MSGTNAHLIVESAPAEVESAPAKVTKTAHESLPQPEKWHILPLSARKEATLASLAGTYRTWLESEANLDLGGLCQSAGLGRQHLALRASLVFANRTTLLAGLTALQEGTRMSGVLTGQVKRHKPLKLAWLFTGQGSQYPGMAQQLYHSSPLFRSILDECQEILRSDLDVPLLNVIFPSEADRDLIHETAYTQPALFAIEYALAQLYLAKGIRPALLLGHSVGEYVAACVAGVFSLADGLHLIASRARLMQSLPRIGAMAAIFSSEASVRAVIANSGHGVDIAAVNGPEHTVISGPQADIRALVAMFDQQGIMATELKVSHAFHSALMEPILAEFGQIAASLNYQPPRIPIVSNVTGQLWDEAMPPAAEYWPLHLRRAVQFLGGVETLSREGITACLEIGPNPVLTGMGKRCLPGQDMTFIASLRSKCHDDQMLAESLGQLYVLGAEIDWTGTSPYHGPRLTLPSAPFQNRRCWIDGVGVVSNSPSGISRKLASALQHPLLGNRVASPLPDIQYENVFRPRAPHYITDHRVYERIVVPAASHLVMGMSAAEQGLHLTAYSLNDWTFVEPLVLGDDEARPVQFILGPAVDNVTNVQLCSQIAGQTSEFPNWTVHATGQIRPASSESAFIPAPPLAELVPRFVTPFMAPERLYQEIWQTGIQLGPTFRWIEALWKDGSEALARLRLPQESDQAEKYPFHPGLIDSCFQLLAALFPIEMRINQAWIPLALERFTVIRPRRGQVWCYGRLDPFKTANPEIATVNLFIYDENEGLIARVENLHIKRAPQEALRQVAGARQENWLHRLEWQALPQPIEKLTAESASSGVSSVSEARSHWVILADRQGGGTAWASELADRGETVTPVYSANLSGVAERWIDPHRESGVAERWIDPHRENVFEALLDELSRESVGSQLRLIYAWHLDDATITAADELAVRLGQHIWNLSRLLRALGQMRDRFSGQIWLITQGSQAVGSLKMLRPALLDAALWGFGKTAALEHPAEWGGLLDLDPQVSLAGSAGPLIALLRSTPTENLIAIRNEQGYRARLVPQLAPAETKALTIRPDAAYLITGGLRGLGLHMAIWLVGQGARFLVLTGRSVLAAENEPVVAELIRLGATIRVIPADIAQLAEVNRLFDEMVQTMPPLAGVIHAAGLLDDGPLTELTLDRINRVLDPKVRGSWYLHQATLALPLDFFVLFSSMAALIGAARQANYAAANAFLDGLARWRQAAGLPALSINWGPWSEVGMAANPENLRLWASLGVQGIPTAKGTALFGQILSAGWTEMAVLPIDWSRFMAQFAAGSQPALLENLAPKRAEQDFRVEREALAHDLGSVAAEERRTVLIEHIRQLVARVSHLDASELGDISQPLNELGIDSPMALELVRLLGGTTGIKLPATLLFNYPTMAALADFLLPKLFAGSAVVTQAKEDRPSADEVIAAEVAREIADLSEEDLSAMLEDELADLDID
jgi:acyl transferase domain-containing protein